MTEHSNIAAAASPAPRLSIGLPVYNGAQFLDRCLQSILSQTFADFELIICDNASTDETLQIAQRWMATDSRIRIHRVEQNAGAAANFNWAFALSRGELFKWCAADDLMEPDFLARCIDALDRDQTAVLAYSGAIDIDENERILHEICDNRWELKFDSDLPHLRFRDLICADHSCIAVFGVIRSAVLKQTAVIGPYVGSDRVLLADLGLKGKFLRVADRLLLHREHKGRSVNEVADLRQRAAWFDPARAKRRVFPYWKFLAEYFTLVWTADLSLGQRLRCTVEFGRWLRRGYARKLLRDLTYHLDRGKPMMGSAVKVPR